MSNSAYIRAVHAMRALRPEQKRLARALRCLASRRATPGQTAVYWLLWFRWRAVTDRIGEMRDTAPYPYDGESIDGDIPPSGPMPTYG